MALTPEQIPVFRAALYAVTDPEFVGYREAGMARPMSEWWNRPADPPKTVWKSNLELEEITSNGFDWVRVDNLSVGKARIWEWMFGNEQKSINPSKPNIRAGIAEVWKGTAADLAVQATVLNHCKRGTSRIEALFAVGTGTAAAPATMGFEGLLTEMDISFATAPE